MNKKQRFSLALPRWGLMAFIVAFARAIAAARASRVPLCRPFLSS